MGITDAAGGVFDEESAQLGKDVLQKHERDAVIGHKSRADRRRRC